MAPIFPRNGTMLIALATALCKSSTDLDAIFRLAATK
jgi:hypothetical protein